MKKIGQLLLIGIATVCLCGCGSPDLAFLAGSQDDASTFLYYVNQEENQLKSVGYTFEDPDASAEILEVLAAQTKEPPSEDLVQLLPENVTVQSYEVEGKTLHLDLSQEFQTLDTKRQILAFAGLVKTFDQIEGIDAVLLTVDGHPLTDSSGKPIGALTADSFME